MSTDLLNKIWEEIKSFRAEMQTMKQENSDSKDQLNKIFNTCTQTEEKIKEISLKNEKNAEEIEKLQGIVSKLENQNSYLEQQIKKKNLIIYNILETNEENYADLENTLIELINAKMELNIQSQDIEEISRIGKIREYTNRPIKVVFTSIKLRNTILRNSSKLKGSDTWIKTDMTKKMLNEQIQLKSYQNNLKKLGYNATIKANKLYIDNVVIPMSEIKEILDIAQTNRNEQEDEGNRTDQNNSTHETNYNASEIRTEEKSDAENNGKNKPDELRKSSKNNTKKPNTENKNTFFQPRPRRPKHYQSPSGSQTIERFLRSTTKDSPATPRQKEEKQKPCI